MKRILNSLIGGFLRSKTESLLYYLCRDNVIPGEIMDLSVKIVALYGGNPKDELSIREISIRLKATYSLVYKAVEKLSSDGVLQIAVKGRAKMCSLNLKSDKARALLAIYSVNDKEEFFRKNKLVAELLSKFVNQMTSENIYSIVLFGSYAKGSANDANSDIDLLVLGSSKAKLDNKVNSEANSLEAQYGKELNAVVLDRNMFLKSLRSEGITVVKEALACHVILSGFERFWELVGEALK